MITAVKKAPVNPNLAYLRKEIPKSSTRIVALQGGTRSGKTYSAIQFIIENCFRYTGVTYSVVRETMTALRTSAMADFIELLGPIYDDELMNHRDNIYNLNGNNVEFFGVMDPQRVRSRKRDLIFICEANELTLEAWRQLALRTSGKIIIDYNPSEPEHWIYEHVLTRKDCRLIITTYKDNPHLSRFQREEIEQYKITDPEYFRVFGEGQRGAARKGQIYKHFQKIAEMPAGRPFYGLDFGKTNDPTALVELIYEPGKLYVDELIYQTNLSSSEIIKMMKAEELTKRDRIRADSSEPLMIREIKDGGFDIEGAVKGPGSVSGGIDKLKSLEVYVTSRSKNLWKEVDWYVWKMDRKTGEPVSPEDPVDMHNHGMDAIRYGLDEIKFVNFSKRKPMAIGRRN